MKSIPKNNTPILVVDDDEGILRSIKTILMSSSMPEPALVSDGRQVVKLVREHGYRLILLDLMMPGCSGMDILKQLKKEFPSIECVIVSAIDEVASAVQAMKFGAYDYLVKPLNSEKLAIVMNRALERYDMREKLALFERSQSFSDLKFPSAFNEMISQDKTMALVFHQAEAAASTDYNVVITGESGTGKEMLAHIIHKLSDRSKNRFLAVNMGSFSVNLFEDSLFGHTKGAYTGAITDKKGFFEEAHGSTLFLDEITELETSLQAKLLRVIQERELYRLGSTEVKNVDVRIIAATNRNIQEEISKNRFRADLFYRLNTCHINIPSLSERKDDILPLSYHFLKRHARKNGKEIHSLAPDLAGWLLEYPFPGNVRELENIIAGAILLEKRNVLTLSSTQSLVSFTDSSRPRGEGLLSLAEVESQHIKQVLRLTGGNRTKAAKALGIGLRTLQRKLKTFSDIIPTASR